MRHTFPVLEGILEISLFLFHRNQKKEKTLNELQLNYYCANYINTNIIISDTEHRRD